MIKSNVILVLLLLLVSPISMADTDMDSFFADSDNMKNFEESKKNNTLDGARKQLQGSCQQANDSGEASIDCGCFDKELANVSDKELYYDSVIAYQEFNEKVEAVMAAQNAGNEEEAERIKNTPSKREGFMNNIMKTCSK